MSSPILPINFNNPPSLPAKGDISSLANKDTINTLNNVKSPTTFGDQTKTPGQVVKATTGNSTLDKLKKEQEELIKREKQLDEDYKQLQEKNKNNQIELEKLKVNYDIEKKTIQTQKDQIQKSIDDILKDPFKKQKNGNKNLKNRLKNRKKKNREEQNKAKKQASNAVLKNSKKNLPSILALLLTNKIAEVVAQNGKIQKLVDDTNAIITDANESGDQTKLNAAKNARNSAIRIIQNNEEKINAIRSQIQRISTYINIFNVIINIISAIPLPTSVPPGVGIPTSVIIKFVKILEKANKILLSLSALIPILLSSLDKAIATLQDLKSQLLDINRQLDKSATDNTLGAASLLSSPDLFGATSETYKGYKFALREENNPRFNVRGFKRHYAVAIDASNVEVLKSEYSFTLDPNDLIEQLKLAIDNQGLTTGNGLSSPKGNPNPSSTTSTSPQQTNQPPTAISGIPSSSVISQLSRSKEKPPQPKVIVGPAGGTTAKIPLGVVEKARLVALAAASGPNPAPKIDVAFIIAADTKWQSDYKKYQRRIAGSANTTV